MTVAWETIDVGGKPMQAYVGVSGDPHGSAVIVAHHASGIDASTQDAVHRLFRAGYTAVAPDLFHRQPADTERSKRSGLLLDAEILIDVAATISFLKKRGYDGLGIVGFCMGGRVSYLAATAIGDLSAAVVFYGGNIMKSLGGGLSPFERSIGIRCPVLLMGGIEDVNPSPTDMQRISTELTTLGKTYEAHLYPDAGHAFHNFCEPRYRPRAAQASWQEMRAFFGAHLNERQPVVEAI